MKTTIINHPLAGHYLSHLRDKNTKPSLFRTLTKKLTTLLLLESTKNLPVKLLSIQTPLTKMKSPYFLEKIVIIPILRAGLGMLEAATELLPEVDVGYIGLERDEITAVASSYYKKFPLLKNKTVIILDPMLATGGTALQTIRQIQKESPKTIKFISIISAPEGIALLKKKAKKIELYTAAVDKKLNAQKYIVPGLGDFGDRLYGTL